MESDTEFFCELRNAKWQVKLAKKKKNEEIRHRYLSVKGASVSAHMKCPMCGKNFTKTRKISTFCSSKCAKNFGHLATTKGGNSTFRQTIDSGKEINHLSRMTPEELREHFNREKQIPKRGMFHCVYCGKVGVKQRHNQCYCLNHHSKCKEHFKRFLAILRKAFPDEFQHHRVNSELSLTTPLATH